MPQIIAPIYLFIFCCCCCCCCYCGGRCVVLRYLGNYGSWKFLFHWIIYIWFSYLRLFTTNSSFAMIPIIFILLGVSPVAVLLTNWLCNRGGGRGGYGGGDRRRDSYRDGGSGPDRHHHGGNRSRPYWISALSFLCTKNCDLRDLIIFHFLGGG